MDRIKSRLLARCLRQLFAILCLVLGYPSWAIALEGSSPENLTDNAALKYWPAFTFAQNLPSATAAAVSSFNKRQSSDKCDLPEGYATAMLLLRQGAALPVCRWGVPLESDGGAAALLRETQARSFAYYARFVAYQLNLLGKTDEAEADLLGIMALGRHFRNPDGSLIDFIVGFSIESIGITGLAELYPDLDHLGRCELATRIQSQRPGSPISACLSSERRVMNWMILHANDPIVGIETQESLIPLLKISPLTALGLPKTELMNCAQQTNLDYDALERLWSLPATEYPAAAKEFYVRSLNPLSAVLLPEANLVWRVQYHNSRGIDLLVAMLMASEPTTDAHLKALGALITPGPPWTVALPDPPDVKDPESRRPMSVVFGRPILPRK